jgi:UDP-glucose 4-epimerase
MDASPGLTGVDFEYSDNFGESLSAHNSGDTAPNVVLAMGIASPHFFEQYGPNQQSVALRDQLAKLAAELNKSPHPRVGFISSGGTVYGESSVLHVETDVCSPLTEYGKYQLDLEHLLRDSLGDKLTVFRLANPYGHEQEYANQQGLIAYLASAIGKSEIVTLFGHGTQIRDYIQIADAARILNDVMDLHPRIDIVNIGTGVGTSNLDVAHLVAEALDQVLRINLVPSRVFDLQTNVLDVSKAKSLGILPAASLTKETLGYLRGGL